MKPIRAEEYARAYLSKHRLLQQDVFDMRANRAIDSRADKTARHHEQAEDHRRGRE